MSKSLAIVKQYASNPEIVERFHGILGESEARPYIESVITVVTNSPSLQECSPESIMHSALRAATLRLSVDPAMHQAHLVPYSGAATLIVDYRGLVELMERTGQYKVINVSEVYSGETVKKNRVTGEVTIEGTPVAEDEDHVIGWMAYFEKVNGMKHWLYMTNEDCDKHGQRYSKAFTSKRSAWTTDRAKMRRKTALRCLANQWGSYSPSVKEVLAMSDDVVDAEISELPMPPATADLAHYGSEYEQAREQAKMEAGYEEMTDEERDGYDAARQESLLNELGY